MFQMICHVFFSTYITEKAVKRTYLQEEAWGLEPILIPAKLAIMEQSICTWEPAQFVDNVDTVVSVLFEWIVCFETGGHCHLSAR
jgi:hypothetical protein